MFGHCRNWWCRRWSRRWRIYKTKQQWPVECWKCRRVRLVFM